MTSTSSNFDNLVRIGKLKEERPARAEFEGLVASGQLRLHDAKNEALSFESRFDLAYNASHALSLAALRWHGYRSENRYLVFQLLEQTLAIPAARWRVLAKCHSARNQAEYGGVLDLDEGLLRDAIQVAEEVLDTVMGLDREW